MKDQKNFRILPTLLKSELLNKLKGRKATAYIRMGSFSDEIIWGERKFVFPTKKKKIASGIWIFRSVMNDVREYVAENKIRAKKRLPVNYWNEHLKKFKGKITATDVDHAYWKIAFLEGIIKEKTYKKGLLMKEKSLRLAALANLASTKEYYIIKDGVITDKTIVLKHDPILQKVYNNIRFICYDHMMRMAKLLGSDFICYKTDCIYYKDSPGNRKIVQDYLDNNQLQWKQLIEPDHPEEE